MLIVTAELVCDENWCVRSLAVKVIGAIGAFVATPILDAISEPLGDEKRHSHNSAAKPVAELTDQGLRLFGPNSDLRRGVWKAMSVDDLSSWSLYFHLQPVCGACDRAMRDPS